VFGRACRLVFASTVVACALVGALTAPAHLVLLIAPACGFSVGSAVAGLLAGFPEVASAHRAAVLAGTWTGLLVPAFPGAGAVGVEAELFALALVGLGAVAVVAWMAGPRGASAGGSREGVDEEQLRQLVVVLSNAELLREWRECGEHLRPGADLDLRARAVVVRNLVLEEFARRDPAAVGRWLSDGDENAPEQYLRDDRRRSA
jgi:hypothetical protein